MLRLHLPFIIKSNNICSILYSSQTLFTFKEHYLFGRILKMLKKDRDVVVPENFSSRLHVLRCSVIRLPSTTLVAPFS